MNTDRIVLPQYGEWNMHIMLPDGSYVGMLTLSADSVEVKAYDNIIGMHTSGEMGTYSLDEDQSPVQARVTWQQLP